MTEPAVKNKLWTYDFTTITIGSLISLVGNTLSGFAISLVVLDYTGSTFLYTLYNVCNQLPMLICPILAGPYLDRMSRKKVIYRLDYASSVIYLTLFLLLRSGWFNYPIMLCACLLIGSINGTYTVAYDSFYPNLISEGNYRKAYSVSSMLWPLAAVMTPVAAAIYDWAGSATPIFAINSVCFFVAACFERAIRHQETHMAQAHAPTATNPVRRFMDDFIEGVDYLRSEKGLLIIALYFVASNICYGADALQLPYFRNHPQRFAAWPVAAVTLYSIVSNFSVVGRLTGGLIQYKVSFPAEKKFTVALIVYISLSVLRGSMLYLPVPVIAVCYFLTGILGVTSYNIRISATQAYVPDDKRARFNGTFYMLTSVGSIIGSLLAGFLGELFSERPIILGVNLFALLVIYLLVYRGRRHVAAIYNTDM